MSAESLCSAEQGTDVLEADVDTRCVSFLQTESPARTNQRGKVKMSTLIPFFPALFFEELLT